MKRSLLLAAVLLTGLSTASMAQVTSGATGISSTTYMTSTTSTTSTGGTKSYYIQTIKRPVEDLEVKGKSRVMLTNSMGNFPKVVVSGQREVKADSNWADGILVMEGNKLIINDINGDFSIKVNIPSKLASIKVGPEAMLSLDTANVPTNREEEAIEIFTGEVLTNLANEVKNATSSTTTSSFDAEQFAQDFQKRMEGKSHGEIIKESFGMIDSMITIRQEKSAHEGYRFGKRFSTSLLWAFNNWGPEPFTGLAGMKEDGYSLKTSFSSYQLEARYNVVMVPHFALALGLGYESDVYKFHQPCVNYVNNVFQAYEPVEADVWKTKMVARYVNFPVTLEYRTSDKSRYFAVSLSAIPGLAFSTSHTGLKHVMLAQGKDFKEVIPMNGELNPFKMDVRLGFDFSSFNVFLQAAVTPLMFEGRKIYPVKIGFGF